MNTLGGKPTKFIPMGAVVTAFGTGAEMNNGAVITNTDKMMKSPVWGAFYDFAILDPVYTMTMPMKQVISGAFDTECYSLWGGSAGARMAAYLGSYGPEYFGGADLPQPGTVVMQYTGHSEYTRNDPPTYACCGTSDGIANRRTMQRRLQAMSAVGILTEFHKYEGLSHGFGLGTGTVAEGWIYNAIAFWEKQM